MKYYLGVDNGGTSTKAALYDVRGRELCSAARETAVLTPGPDCFERDMEEMWEANCAVIRETVTGSGVDPGDIAGVAVCGHGKGLYLWGREGKPVRNGILSADNRAYAYVERWRKDGTEARAFARSCQHIMACQPVALLPWLRDHEPEAIPRIQWVFGCKDYVRFRLTGEARGELTDCSGAGAVNLRTRQYDPALLTLYGLEDLAAAFPPLCRSDEVAGCVRSEERRHARTPRGALAADDRAV